jgi:hypothetical protein
MNETNGEKERLQRQLDEKQQEVARLKDDKLKSLIERVEKNQDWVKSNFAGFDERLRAVEGENLRMAGSRAVYGKALPIIAVIISLAVAIMKLMEMLQK